MIEPFKNPIALTYGEVLRRHLYAAREDFDGPRRARLFNLSEELREEFPEEILAWEAAHTPVDSRDHK